jgi:hypothetical protein
MATKKKAKKAEGKQTMDAAYIKKMQRLVKDIGTHKREGYIFMAAPVGKPDKKGGVKAEGVLFTHGVSGATMLGNLIDHIGADPLTVLAILAQSKGHSHE